MSGSSIKPWFKPPPLDTIDISDEELRKNGFLRFCSVLNVVTGIIGGLSSIVHLFMILRGPWGASNIPAFISRIFFCVFGGMIVLQEQEWAFFFKQFTFLESWIGRGLFLILCSCIMLSAEHPDNKLLKSIRGIVGSLLALLGFLYFNMGCMCFRHIKIRQLNQIRKKKQVYLQAQQLTEHKSEIEKLLRETESKMEIL